MRSLEHARDWILLVYCVMLNVSSKLPKHIVIMMPNEHGGESACKVDVEYEWLPPKCTNCTSLGHATKECPLTKTVKPAVFDLCEENQIPAPVPRTGNPIPTSDPVFDNPVAKDDMVSNERPHQRMIRESKSLYIMLLIYYEMLTKMQMSRLGVLTHAALGCFPMLNTVIWNVRGLNRRIINSPCETLSPNSGYILSLYWKLGLCHQMSLGYKRVYYLDGSGLWITLVLGLTELCQLICLDWPYIPSMQGERFSWHNCSMDGRSLWKRLDRMFVNDAWLEQWPNLFYTCLTPRTSDHSLLVLKGDSRDVQHTSNRYTDVYSVTRKLKALKPVFHQQRRKKGDLANNVKLAAGFLEVAQKLLQADRHNSLLLELENCCRLVYLKATQLEHVMLRQRAKLQWLKGGDQCSKAFFRRVATRRANKCLFQISDSDGLVQTDPNTISSVFHILTEEEACALIRPVTVEEVKTAMFDIGETKHQARWFSSGRLLKQVNATLLTLIPKVRTPHSVADFRPISCCNVIYKVISKILVCRFREILDLLVSPSQNAFVLGGLRNALPLPIFGCCEWWSAWIFCGGTGTQARMVNFLYHWRCTELKLFQLSFADDLLLLCKADMRSVSLFRRGVDLFASLSGLHTNPRRAN
ncbi:hypothetical protein Sango_3071300 [Sesamum angolense]|uniref:CCHC-type domain-containing protein n=1 Tax=Sesamum angolense TaxID=2727404 RepID=A0AAE1TA20_9LAMI|nr:hypothetical protein Sango_3071300 [Sesamum angolense]